MTKQHFTPDSLNY